MKSRLTPIEEKDLVQRLPVLIAELIPKWGVTEELAEEIAYDISRIAHAAVNDFQEAVNFKLAKASQAILKAGDKANTVQ